MKQTFIVKNNAPTLILFFSGWGMDPTPFQDCNPQNADLMICYDYRSLEFDSTLLEGYSSIQLIGWSMGVWIASQVMQGHSSLLRKSIAINGTMYPVDDEKGIAFSVFHLTLRGLNAASLNKFYRRMCGSSMVYDQFLKKAPQRSLDELKEELAYIGERYLSSPPVVFQWDMAIIGEEDRIFLPDHQSKAWINSTLIQYAGIAHYDADVFQYYLNCM